MEASKRRAAPSSLELPDGVLVRVFELVGVRALGAASAATRQWRRTAHTRALWQVLLQQRWTALWASLDAPQHVDARAMYRRLACPRVWRPTTPSEVTLSLEITHDGAIVISAAVSLDELARSSTAAGLPTGFYLIRPVIDERYHSLLAELERHVQIRCQAERMTRYGQRENMLQHGNREEALAASGDLRSDIQAVLMLVRHRDGASVRVKVENESQNADRVEFEDIFEPVHATHSLPRRLALHKQETGADSTTNELLCAVQLSIDGRAHEAEGFEDTAEVAWQPGDVALRFSNTTWRDFEEGDEGEVGFNVGRFISSVALDTHILGGLDWRGG